MKESVLLSGSYTRHVDLQQKLYSQQLTKQPSFISGLYSELSQKCLAPLSGRDSTYEKISQVKFFLLQLLPVILKFQKFLQISVLEDLEFKHFLFVKISKLRRLKIFKVKFHERQKL